MNLCRWLSERTFPEYAAQAARIANRLPLRGIAANLSWSRVLYVLRLLRFGAVRARSKNIHKIGEVRGRNCLTQLC